MSARRGYTLIELLVAVAIVSVLLGLVLAAVQRVRESARRAECQDRMRQQALAVLNYESAHGRLPPGAVQGPFELLGVPDGVSHGMWPLLLSQLGQASLAGHYKLNVPYDHPDNQPVVTARLRVLECGNAPPDRMETWEPSGLSGAVSDFAPLDVNPFLADIGLIDPAAKFESALPVNGRVRMVDIKDGASHTLLLGEAGGRPGMAWASPANLLGVRQFFPGSGGLHRGGTNAAMADGSVRFIRDNVDIRILARLATRAGGEPVPDDF
jgi:prepilin-type N-terminal cleavage/methylation domain-containing protein/prepilin-type processing-associated H-X9-DG protein